MRVLMAAIGAALTLTACGDGTASGDRADGSVPSFLIKSGLIKSGYSGELKLVFLAPDRKSWPADGYREARLLEDFTYVDTKGHVWRVPAGYVTDGASIPSRVWSAGIGPYDGPYRDAAVLHDYYCENKGLGHTWEDVQDMFRDAALARGTSEGTVKLLYGGVYLGSYLGYCTWQGRMPAKQDNASFVKSDGSTFSMLHFVGMAAGTGPQTALSTEDLAALKELQDWIKRTNPSFEEIRLRVQEIKKRKGTRSGT